MRNYQKSQVIPTAFGFESLGIPNRYEFDSRLAKEIPNARVSAARACPNALTRRTDCTSTFGVGRDNTGGTDCIKKMQSIGNRGQGTAPRFLHLVIPVQNYVFQETSVSWAGFGRNVFFILLHTLCRQAAQYSLQALTLRLSRRCEKLARANQSKARPDFFATDPAVQVEDFARRAALRPTTALQAVGSLGLYDSKLI